MNNRRQFLATAASLAAAPVLAQSARQPKTKIEFCVFTKPFNSLSFDELADRVAELGFDGIEAPIRAGGHVEPTEVEDKLPALVEALRRRDLQLTVMASDINDPNDPLTKRVLSTASSLGVRRYRMKYFKYDLKASVLDQIAEWKPLLQDLADINHDLEIQGLYQNHAGSTNMGAALWDLKLALEGISPDDIGVAYDIRHATVEGGMSWPATFNMIRSQVQAVYVKDFEWGNSKPINTPLGNGRVDSKFLKMLRDGDFDGPISLHEEYLDHRRPELVGKHLAAIKKDFHTLKQWLK